MMNVRGKASRRAPGMHRVMWGLLSALCAIAFGCAQTDEPRMVLQTGSGDLGRAMLGVRTVALHPNRIARPFPGGSANTLRATTDRAIIALLRRAGYAMGSPRQADRVIAYAIGVTGELDDRTLARTFGISPGLDLQHGVTRGGLSLILIDSATGGVVWKASGSAPADQGADRAVVQQRINTAVQKLMATLPPRR